MDTREMKHNYKPLVFAVIRMALVLSVTLILAAVLGLEGWGA